MLSLFYLLLFSIIPTESARILAIIPTASRSHQRPFQPLWRELAARGHQVTVMTTDPENNSIPNLTEIDLSFTYDIYNKFSMPYIVTHRSMTNFWKSKYLSPVLRQAQQAQLSIPEVQRLIHSREIEFDLVMVEAHLPGFLAFGWRFKCPIILLCSTDCSMRYHDAMGNQVHPIVNPDKNVDIEEVSEMTITDRIVSVSYMMIYKLYDHFKLMPAQYESMKKYFGDDLPDLVELQKNISMMFTGIHPILSDIRPINPNTIPYVGTHLEEPQEIPLHIRQFLAGAKNGAIYFSLGSNVNAGILNEDFFITLVDTFATLPYRFIMKLDVKLLKQPKNVMVEKWLPQQDILRHPKIKLFITQGGLQSLQEALTFEVPIIGIPFFGDQLANVNKAVNKGYGLYIDKKYFSKRYLNETINEMMGNPKYAEKVKELGAIFRDEETPSLQRAVYWTEYVIRHKGAPHLRSPAAAMPAWQFYMLDVIAFFFLIAFVMSFLFFLFIYYSIKLLWKAVRMGKKPAKKSKRKIR